MFISTYNAILPKLCIILIAPTQNMRSRFYLEKREKKKGRYFKHYGHYRVLIANERTGRVIYRHSLLWNVLLSLSDTVQDIYSSTFVPLVGIFACQFLHKAIPTVNAANSKGVNKTHEPSILSLGKPRGTSSTVVIAIIVLLLWHLSTWFVLQ